MTTELTKPRTKIICTIGPSTQDDDILREMIRAGMTVARLNFSHGSHEEHRRNIERVRHLADELNTPVAIMGDTKGPEIRTRLNVDHKPFELRSGDHVIVTTRDVAGTSECFSLDYERLPQEVEPGSTIFVDDGLIALKVERVDGTDIHCLIENGGCVGERKGVNVPNVHMSLPNVTDQDRLDLAFACEMGIDAIAASFIRNPEAVHEIRDLCAQYGSPDMMIISKIESSLALNCLDDIIEASDGIMVARGDLGVEIPAPELPYLQKEIISKCNSRALPVITATQMLESMTQHPRPTRAEVTDVANAIIDGSDCVMLSGETAAGNYPLEAVNTMADVCRQTESHLVARDWYHGEGGVEETSAITAHAAVTVATCVRAAAILCPTYNGNTAREMSALRPRLSIVAATPKEETRRRTCFYWGVESVLSAQRDWLSQICYNSLHCATKAGLVNYGDTVVITVGDQLTSPSDSGNDPATNVCMIAQVV